MGNPLERSQYVKRKISPEDPEYQLARTERVAFSNELERRAYSGCYGALDLGSIHYMESPADSESRPRDAQPTQQPSFVGVMLHNSMEAFVEKAGKRNPRSELRAFLAEALLSPKIKRAISILAKKHQDELFSQEEKLLRAISDETHDMPLERAFMELLRQEMIPTTLWQTVLEHHKARFIETLRRFEKRQLPLLKEQFRIRAEKSIQNGWLPVTEQRLAEAMDNTVVTLSDGLCSKFDDADGEYQYGTGQIHLASYLSSGEAGTFAALEDVYTHEMIHALAGRTVLATNEPKHSDYPTTYDHVRAGISMDNTGEESRFRWLDEALTEQIALVLLGRQSDVYVQERLLLHHLMTAGKKQISFALFQNAYFEDHDPAASPTIPHWRALRAALNESFDAKYLVQIDAAIQNNGIDAVLAELGLLGEAEEQKPMA